MQFDLAAYTSRRTILDPGKLRSLNKTYLWQQSQDSHGLASLAKQVKGLCKERFSEWYIYYVFQLGLAYRSILISDNIDKIDFEAAVLSFEVSISQLRSRDDFSISI